MDTREQDGKVTAHGKQTVKSQQPSNTEPTDRHCSNQKTGSHHSGSQALQTCTGRHSAGRALSNKGQAGSTCCQEHSLLSELRDTQPLSAPSGDCWGISRSSLDGLKMSQTDFLCSFSTASHSPLVGLLSGSHCEKSHPGHCLCSRPSVNKVCLFTRSLPWSH